MSHEGRRFNQKVVQTDRQEIMIDIQILENLINTTLLHQSTINYHHLGNDLHKAGILEEMA